MSTQALPVPSGYTRTLGLGVVLLTVAAVVLVAADISASSYKRPLLMMVLLVQFLTALRRWRLSVYLFVAYIFVEGFIINFYSGQPELNLLKDAQMSILFLLLTAATTARHLSPMPRSSWLYLYLVFAAVYAATALNPALPSIAVGLIGIRVTLIFAMCVGIAYWFFRSTTDVIRFLHFHTWISIPISIFGIVQYFTGPSLLLSISPGFSRAIFYAHIPGAQGYFRTISTFASTGGFSQYLWAAFVLTWAFYLVAPTKRQKWLALIAGVLQVGGALSSGGRAPVILTVVSLLFGYALMRRLTRGFLAAGLATMFLVGAIVFVGGDVTSRFATILDIESANQRNRSLIVDEFVRSMSAPIEGVGAGQLTAAANRWSENRGIGTVENQLARIRYEAGILGLLLFLIAFGVMGFTAAKLALAFRNPVRRIVGGVVAGFFVTAILIMPVGTPLDVPPTNFYFWFLFGLLHAMARDEDLERAAALAANRRAADPAGA